MIITPETNIFISGNFTDTERDIKIIRTLLSTAGFRAIVKDGSIAEPTEKLIQECQFFLAVVGLEEGAVKTPTGETLPQMELNMAIRERKPIVAFIKNPIQESPHKNQQFLRRYLQARLAESAFLYDTVGQLPFFCHQMLVTIDTVAIKLKPNKVFISYSSKDKPTVERIVQRLKQGGIHTFFDEHDIGVGESLKKMIRRAISSVGYIVVCLSRHSVNSDWVRTELTWALEHANRLGLDGDPFIIPVRLDAINLPRPFEYLGDLKYADVASDFETGVQTLMAALMK